METVQSALKRKKRKTRKCLDELRKRSRRNANGCDTYKKSPLVNKLGEAVTHLVRLKPIIGKNCITSTRLTLPMHPKAIQSETITRPELSEIRQARVLNRKLTSTVTSANIPLQVSNSESDLRRNSDEDIIDDTFGRYSEINQISPQELIASGNVSDQSKNSPSSFILFSPLDQVRDTDILEESPFRDTASTPTSPSSHSSHEDYGYHLYEEFMNEIPTYIKQNTPALIKEDVLMKIKSLKQNLYREECHQECEDNILNYIKTNMLTNNLFSPSSAIVENTMDYIRQRLKSSAPISTNSGSPCSSITPPTAPTHDTPDYIYYPHKLNHCRE